MTVREQLVTLAEIGIWDLKRKLLVDQRGKLPAKAVEAQIAADKLVAQQQQLQSQLDVVLVNKKAALAQLDTEKGNMRKWEARADKIKGEREYTALMSEIGSQRNLVEKLEAKINEATAESKKFDDEIAKLKPKVDAATAKAKEEHTAIEDALKALDAEMMQMESARNKLLLMLPTLVAKKYESVAPKRAGLGVTVVKNEVCTSCMRTLPAELYIRIARAEIVEQCPSCQRLLVTEEMSKSVAPSQDANEIN